MHTSTTPRTFDLTKQTKNEREIGASCINGTYLDELDINAGRKQEKIAENCTLSCQMILDESK